METGSQDLWVVGAERPERSGAEVITRSPVSAAGGARHLEREQVVTMPVGGSAAGASSSPTVTVSASRADPVAIP